MAIILIGFMGSGKSTLAQTLATTYNLTHLDMDEQILKTTKITAMAELFKRHGELFLREQEIDLAKKCHAEVIATGGGVVLNKIILDYFKMKGGTIFFLNACLETILLRLQGDVSRPLFADAKELYFSRKALYEKYADHVINVESKTKEEIAKEIWEVMHLERSLESQRGESPMGRPSALSLTDVLQESH